MVSTKSSMVRSRDRGDDAALAVPPQAGQERGKHAVHLELLVVEVADAFVAEVFVDAAQAPSRIASASGQRGHHQAPVRLAADPVGILPARGQDDLLVGGGRQLVLEDHQVQVAALELGDAGQVAVPLVLQAARTGRA